MSGHWLRFCKLINEILAPPPPPPRKRLLCRLCQLRLSVTTLRNKIANMEISQAVTWVTFDPQSSLFGRLNETVLNYCLVSQRSNNCKPREDVLLVDRGERLPHKDSNFSCSKTKHAPGIIPKYYDYSTSVVCFVHT